MRLRTAASWLLASILVTTTSVPATAQGAVSLPATGQTASYAAGDDGDLQTGVVWPNPRFTTVGDGTMADNLTGLRWTVNANAPGPSACSPGAYKQWQAALDYVACLNTNGYLGHADWRLPNVNEIHSLWYQKGTNPNVWLAAQGFTNVQGTSYWSSTTYAYDSANAWYVKITGPLGFDKKTLRLYVWPVRGATAAPARVWRTGQTASYASGDDGAIQAGETWPSPRFVTSGDCVTDQLTGLQWPKAPDPTVRSWPDALAHANALTLCGSSDWRLPNLLELASLQHFGVAEPATWLNTQGFEGLPLDTTWASTTHYSSTGMAWVVKLWRIKGGNTVDYLNWTKTYRNCVLPVRTAGATPAFSILTATRAGTGSGAVTSGDGFINCGTTCSKRYANGTAVTLTATPDAGSTFAGWSGAADCADGQVTLAADTTCTATFDPPPATQILTTSRTGTGSGTVRTAEGLIDCGNTCSATYSPGVSVTLIAIPALGSELSAWGGDSDCVDGLLTMDAAKACTATFTRRTLQQGSRVQRTGQVTTYDSGDDGEIRAGIAWPSPRFVVSGDCGRDELTGLTWLRDPDVVFRTWPQALSWANNLSACGYSDWRLPNANELLSVLTSSAAETTWLSSFGFSVNSTGAYWSSTSSPRQPHFAFKLGTGIDLTDFGDGNSTIHIGGDKRTEVKLAWPVRGTATGPAVPPKTGQTSCYDSTGGVIACGGTGQDGELQTGAAWPAARFSVRGECIVDRQTGLMWPANANLYSTYPGFDDPVSWYVALDRANDLERCGYSDWRLPNRDELWSLNNRGVADFYAWTNTQGFSKLVDLQCVWTSTTTPYAPAFAVIYFMRDVNENIFNDKTFSGTGACDAWPVRTAVFTLTVSKEGNGSGTVTSADGGIDCGADCSEPYLVATAVTLSAVPAAGSTFVGWSGHPDCADGVVTIDDDTTCAAIFATTGSGQPLAVSLSGAGTGTVTSAPPGIDCGSACIGWFTAGSTVVLTAAPTDPSTFDGWSGACSGTGPCEVELDQPRVVGAAFGPGCATGDVNCDGAVDVQDVFYLINFLFAGGPNPIGPADVNADSLVNVQDVFSLINYLFAGGPTPT